MKLLVFILNKEECLESVLEAYIEAGVTGSTILDSGGMGQFLTNHVPLFSDFREFMKGAAPRNKTILSVIHDESSIEPLAALVGDIVGGFGRPGSGIMFTVPIDWATPRGVGRGEENR